MSNKIPFEYPKEFTSQCYDVCPLSKFRCLPFVFHNNFSKEPFDLVHCDIWGPFSHPTHDGESYFLTIVDDWTRFISIHLMHHKSEASHLIKNFFNHVQTQFSKTIKGLRYNNGKEFALTKFLQEKGTIHQLSCPECNG